MEFLKNYHFHLHPVLRLKILGLFFPNTEYKHKHFVNKTLFILSVTVHMTKMCSITGIYFSCLVQRELDPGLC